MCQDDDTASAVGSKSYNAIMEELVALETQRMEQSKNNPEDDCIDFVAATTATLGVPSPCLSKAQSFDESPRSVSEEQRMRKGDLEEEAELLRALKLSESETPTSMSNNGVANSEGPDTTSTKLDGEPSPVKVSVIDTVEETIVKDICAEDKNINQLPESSIVDAGKTSLSKSNEDMSPFPIVQGQVSSSPLKTDAEKHLDQSVEESEGHKLCQNLLEKDNHETLVETAPSSGKEALFVNVSPVDISQTNDKSPLPASSEMVDHRPGDMEDPVKLSGLSPSVTSTDSAGVEIQCIDVPEALTSTVGSEPIYEGEECILDPRSTVLENREPVYEGEVVLAEQGCGSSVNACNAHSKDEISPKQGRSGLYHKD